MNILRMLGFAVACCLALSACDHEPTFDASSVPAYQRSLSEIEAKLSAADQGRLKVALVALAMGGADDYMVFGRDSPSKTAGFETLEGVANPTIYLDRMRSRIDGKTAAAVIRRVADDLDVAIAHADVQGGGSDKVFKAFVIENAQFYWDRSYGRAVPMARFSIYNGSTIAVSNIQLTAILAVPGDKEPVAIGGLVDHFPLPLQPGAEETVTIELAAAGQAITKRLADTYNADLTLRFSNIDDTSGKRLLVTDAEVLDIMRHKRDALRGG